MIQGNSRQGTTRHRATGTPDLLGFCHHGRVVAIEVKTCDGEATEEQSRFLADVVFAGGIAAVCDSVESAENVIRAECAGHEEAAL